MNETMDVAKPADARAFEEFVRTHFSTVYCVALGYVGSREAAEDIAQDAFLRAYLKLQTLRDPHRLLPWTLRIARNLSADSLRSRKASSRLAQMVPLDDLDSEPGDRGCAWESLSQREESRLVRDAVLALPRRQREVVLLHYAEQLSKSEVARRLRIHPTSVGRRLDDALYALRLRLQHHLRMDLAPLRSRASVRRRTVAAAGLLLALPHAVRAQAIKSPSALAVGLHPLWSFFCQALSGRILLKAGKLMKSYPAIPLGAALAAVAVFAALHTNPAEAQPTTASAPAAAPAQQAASAQASDPTASAQPSPEAKPAGAPAAEPSGLRTETRKLDAFRVISISGNAEIKTELGSGAHDALITADERTLENLTMEVINGRLEIGSKGPHVSGSRAAKIALRAESIDRVDLSGSAKIDVPNVAVEDTLTINISGSGKVSATGAAKSVIANISGSGDAILQNVIAGNVAANISGSGKASVHATESLRANIAGSGTVSYSGSPKVTKAINGTGKLVPLQ